MDTNSNYRWSRKKRSRYVARRSTSLGHLLASLAVSKRSRASRQATFDKLCNFMLSSGGVYTKFLQGVLLGVPEVQAWVKDQSIDFFENVPTEPLDASRILQQELGSQITRLQLRPEVIASGTFAQVYSGLLDHDQSVVIKIQRPTIRPSLRSDVWMLKKFARYGKPFLTTLDVDISKDFARLTLAEMDYKREAALGESLRERMLETHPKAIIPKTYKELSSSHVLVQERLGGVSLSELIRSGAALNAQQRQTLQEMATTVIMLPFTTGFVHADPHPGNLRLIGDRFGLLDFGAVDDKYVDLNLYRTLLESIVKAMDGTITAAEALNAYFAAYAPRLHRALDITSHALSLPSVVDLFASYSLGLKASTPLSGFKGNVQALADINKLVNPGNRFVIKSTPQNVSYTRAVHTLMHTMQLLGLKQEVAASMHMTLERLASLSPEEQPARDVLSVAEAKEIVYSWLEKVVERNPFMAGELRQAFNALKHNEVNESPQNQVEPT
jgi:tRNA A-37 threonylcarbamoyl transferase component Bud32